MKMKMKMHAGRSHGHTGRTARNICHLLNNDRAQAIFYLACFARAPEEALPVQDRVYRYGRSVVKIFINRKISYLYHFFKLVQFESQFLNQVNSGGFHVRIIKIWPLLPAG